jgi:Ca2+/Na+ antiporter
LASHYTINSIEKLIALTGLSEMSAGFILLATLTSVPEILVALFCSSRGTWNKCRRHSWLKRF